MPTSEPPDSIPRADDLHHALAAIRGDNLERLRLGEDGILFEAPLPSAASVAAGEDVAVSPADGAPAPGAPPTPPLATPAALAAAGSRRLCVLLHNNLDNKMQALARGALGDLAAALMLHAGDYALLAAFARAVRAVCFRCDAALEAAGASGIVLALVQTLRSALVALEAVAGSEGAAEEGGADAGVGAADALAAADETLVALSTLTLANRHSVQNAALALAEGAREAATTAVTMLSAGDWQARVRQVGNGGDGKSGARATPEAVVKKAQLLEAVLG